VSTGQAASYQLDAGRLQDQDTAALLGHDQQLNGHVTALPKTPTICQQMNGHGNISGEKDFLLLSFFKVIVNYKYIICQQKINSISSSVIICFILTPFLSLPS
jgi:hypothetical protein